jgi:PhoH-like ATPase
MGIQNQKRYKILDTNILLLEASNLTTLASDGSTIVLPETVLDELDSKKSGHSEIAFQAREVGRLLARAEILRTYESQESTFTELKLDNINILVASNCQYPDLESAPANIINDRKIIHVATLFPQENATFISNDVMCRIRAQSMGIKVTDYKTVETTNLEFTKEIEVTAGLFTRLHNMPIAEVDPKYKPENFNYIFTDLQSGQRKLATVARGVLQVIGKETEKDLRCQDLNPLNSGQTFLSKALQDTSIDIVVCEALAGSGL